jgi:serine/threonine protein kinase
MSAISTLFSADLQKQIAPSTWIDVQCIIENRADTCYFSVACSDPMHRNSFEIAPQVVITSPSPDTLVLELPPTTVCTLRSPNPEIITHITSLLKEIVSKFQYAMDNFDIITVLGKGFYGKVMLCRRKGTQELYAIKTVHKSRLIQAKKVHTIFNEKNSLTHARHPFIVQIYFAFQTETKFYIGLELVSGGELFKHLCDVGEISVAESRLYVAELALALEYLHSIGFIYRDLKPENVMLDAEGHVKLTDFGLVKQVRARGDTTSTFCGTPEYLAPEMVGERPYTDAVDWWALGILTYEMLFAQTPFFQRQKALMYKMIRTQDAEFPPGADPVAVDFIRGLLKKDPRERLNFESMKKHVFFTGMDFNDVLARKYRPAYVPPRSKTIPEIGDFDSAVLQLPAADSVATPVTMQFEGFSYMMPGGADADEAGEQLPSIAGFALSASAMPTGL